MRIEITKKFIKQSGKLPQEVQVTLKQIIKDVKKAAALEDVNGSKRLKAKGLYYRIRIGDYRAGLFITEDNIVRFAVIGHRKLIYKSFPSNKL